MVTKSKTKTTDAKKTRVKVGKLKLNKETVKDLNGGQQKQIQGGVGKTNQCALCTAEPSGCN